MWQFILTDLIPGSQNLGSITIDEPIGWDKAVLTLKRDTNWHGIFTDYSSSLKFPGTGFKMLKKAWQLYGSEAQIQADIYYACAEKDTPEIIYSGMLNFNNPEFQEGITCLATLNIEPFSDLMAFKNRQDVVVDLDSSLSADQSVSLVPYLALGSGSIQFQLNHNTTSGDYYVSYQYTYNIRDVLDWLNAGYAIAYHTWELFFGEIVPICTDSSGGDTIGSIYDLSSYSATISYLNYTISSGSFPIGGFPTTVYYLQVNSFLPDQAYILTEFNKLANYAIYGNWVQYTPLPANISISGTPWGASLSGFPASGSLGAGSGMPLTLVPKGILLTDFIVHQIIQPNQSQGDFCNGNFTSGGTKGMEQRFWAQALEPSGGPGALSAAFEGFIPTSPGHYNNGGSGTVPFFFANPLPVQQPYDFITQISDLQAEVVQHIHSEKWVYASQECAKCSGTGRVLVQGQQVYTDCNSCKGQGRYVPTSPYENYVVRPPMAGEQAAIIPPAGYIQKQVEIVTIQDERINAHLYRALAAINMEFLAQTPLNQSGTAKEVDRDELNNFVSAIAADMVNILNKIYFIITEYRYRLVVPDADERYAMLPHIAVPEQFDLLSPTYLVEELGKAKTMNLSPVLQNALMLEFAVKKFNNEPKVRDELQLSLSLDPFPGIDEADKTVQLQNGGITKEDYIISCNIYQFVRRALDEYAAHGKDFTTIDFETQKNVVYGYAEEILNKQNNPPANIREMNNSNNDTPPAKEGLAGEE